MCLRLWPLLLSASFANGIDAQNTRTVLDRVFTEAQASRGAQAYTTNCAECHEGADVDGPPLEGKPFVDRWREDNLNVLSTFIETSMPADKPGKLSRQTYLDIMAYLLKANGYPSGDSELTAPALLTTRLVGANGPQPLPTNALVRVVGCLTSYRDDAWGLLHATDPIRTQSADQITPEELTASETQSLGTAAFDLRNLTDVSTFAAKSRAGYKILVKGVLTHQTTADRLNVTAVHEIASSCVP
jgi:mono/diheme cytochrome c family protein